MSVLEVFQSLSHEKKSEILTALAKKLFGIGLNGLASGGGGFTGLGNMGGGSSSSSKK